MKIIHVYAQNLKIFEESLQDTGCRINGSRNLDYLTKSLVNYNSRDVMGLIVFCRQMTKKTLKLIKTFDELFVFNPLPIIVACDDAEALWVQKRFKVKNSPLFLVNSIEGTLSDIDLRRMFTTLSCMSDEMYDLSGINLTHQNPTVVRDEKGKTTQGLLADEVLAECARLGGMV